LLQADSSAESGVESAAKEQEAADAEVEAVKAMEKNMMEQEAEHGRRCVRWGSASCTRWGPYHHCQVYGQRRCARWSMWLQMDEEAHEGEEEASAETEAATAELKEAAEGERLAKEAMEEEMKEQEAAQGRRCVRWGSASCTRWGPYHHCQAFGSRRCVRWSMWLQVDADAASA